MFSTPRPSATLERRELHRILATETWLFGDEYNLAVDDQGLSAALQEHIRILGREQTAEDLMPAGLADGTTAIIDLLLSATIPLPTQHTSIWSSSSSVRA